MGACRFIQYNSKLRDSYNFSMLTMICLQTHILSKDEYAYNFFFKCRTADIYRMRHVIHMPHSIYVSAICQTNTSKNYSKNNKWLKASTTALQSAIAVASRKCTLGQACTMNCQCKEHQTIALFKLSNPSIYIYIYIYI